MDKVNKWRTEEFLRDARGLQNVHYELLNGYTYDVIRRTDVDKFKMILENYLPEDVARETYDKLAQRGSDITFRILIVACNSDNGLFTVPVIKVLEGGKEIFFDCNNREYSDWENFLSYNKFPKSLMVYPENGSYVKEDGELKLGTRESPSASELAEIDEFLMAVAEGISFLSTVAPMVGLCKADDYRVKWASNLADAYRVGHHSYHLYDRCSHGQSIGLSDEASRGHWFNVGRGFISFAVSYWRSQGDKSSALTASENVNHLLATYQSEVSRNDPIRAASMIQRQILCHQLLYFTKEATTYFQELLSPEFDIGKLMFGLRSFLDVEKLPPTLRQLLSVDGLSLKKVAQDIINCNKISLPMIEFPSGKKGRRKRNKGKKKCNKE